jgi:hypothetical protein
MGRSIPLSNLVVPEFAGDLGVSFFLPLSLNFFRDADEKQHQWGTRNAPRFVSPPQRPAVRPVTKRKYDWF